MMRILLLVGFLAMLVFPSCEDSNSENFKHNALVLESADFPPLARESLVLYKEEIYDSIRAKPYRDYVDLAGIGDWVQVWEFIDARGLRDDFEESVEQISSSWWMTRSGAEDCVDLYSSVLAFNDRSWARAVFNHTTSVEHLSYDMKVDDWNNPVEIGYNRRIPIGNLDSASGRANDPEGFASIFVNFAYSLDHWWTRDHYPDATELVDGLVILNDFLVIFLETHIDPYCHVESIPMFREFHGKEYGSHGLINARQRLLYYTAGKMLVRSPYEVRSTHTFWASWDSPEYPISPYPYCKDSEGELVKTYQICEEYWESVNSVAKNLEQ